MYSSRPSSLLDIDDPLHAYWFDRAIMYFGRNVESDMEEAARDSKTQAESDRRTSLAMASWMRDPEEKPKYKDPAAMMRG